MRITRTDTDARYSVRCALLALQDKPTGGRPKLAFQEDDEEEMSQDEEDEKQDDESDDDEEADLVSAQCLCRESPVFATSSASRALTRRCFGLFRSSFAGLDGKSSPFALLDQFVHPPG